jgi:hypothetical protein
MPPPTLLASDAQRAEEEAQLAEARVAEARKLLAEAEEIARQAQAKKQAAAATTANRSVPAAPAPVPQSSIASDSWLILLYTNGTFSARLPRRARPPKELHDHAALAPDEECFVRWYETNSLVAYFTKRKGVATSADQRPVLHGVAVDTGQYLHLPSTRGGGGTVGGRFHKLLSCVAYGVATAPAANKVFQGDCAVETWLEMYFPFLRLAADYVPSKGVTHIAKYEHIHMVYHSRLPGSAIADAC